MFIIVECNLKKKIQLTKDIIMFSILTNLTNKDSILH